MSFVASNPLSFNDPFEVRPWFDQARHDHSVNTHEQFYARIGFPNSLVEKGTLLGVPTEDVVDHGETLNQRFRNELSKRFRVLCLSRNRHSSLMWGHYTGSYEGVVLGIDPTIPGFPCSLSKTGFEIHYTADRSRTKLPLAFYRSPHLEILSMTGAVLNCPDEEVESEAGLIITFQQYQSQCEEAYLTNLTTKALEWRYEEVRFIYDLVATDGDYRLASDLHLVPLPPRALREIIIGFRADFRLVQRIVELFRSGALGSPKLFFSGCHPHCFEVQAHEADDQYLLDYFRVIRPSLDRQP